MRNDPFVSVTVISSPYHVGVYHHEVGAGPSRIREKNLVKLLEALGVQVFQSQVEMTQTCAEGDIGRYFQVLRQISQLVTNAVESRSFPLILSGNCGATIGVLAGLQGSPSLMNEQKDVGCIWFDAHDDFNVPDTVLSGYFDSMPIAIMARQCWKALRETIPGFYGLDLSNVVHVGLRDLNEMELARVNEARFPVIWGDAKKQVNFAAELKSVLQSKVRPPSMVHIDLDCLDSAVGQINKFEPAPGGLSVQNLRNCLKVLAEQGDPTSLTIASFDPAYDNSGKIAEIAVRAITEFIQDLLEKGIIRPEV